MSGARMALVSALLGLALWQGAVWVTGLPDTVDVIVLGQEYVTDGVPVVPSFEEVIQ